MRRLQWLWCWLAFRLYIAMPHARTHRSLYGRAMLWLLGYGGAYAHSSDFAEFDKIVKFGRARG